jgi:hypothetical protein
VVSGSRRELALRNVQEVCAAILAQGLARTLKIGLVNFDLDPTDGARIEPLD